MFERFTEPARRVLFFARDEASQRRGDCSWFDKLTTSGTSANATALRD